MKRLRVDMAAGFYGYKPTEKNKFVQFNDETPEDFIERITTVLFENIEQLTLGQDYD